MRNLGAASGVVVAFLKSNSIALTLEVRALP